MVQIGEGRYRFFAALAEAAELEGREFSSVSDASRAVRRALARAPPEDQASPRARRARSALRL